MTEKITRTSDNIFEDLGFDGAEAANLKIRSDLMIQLRKYIEKNKLKQEQAAEIFGVPRPKISYLVNGQIDKFSIDKLVLMLERAGKSVKVKVA